MGGIFKFALFMLLAMCFFTPPEGTNALKCMTCSSEITDENDECVKGNGDVGLCTIPVKSDICATLIKTHVGTPRYVKRSCAEQSSELYKKIKLGECSEEKPDPDYDNNEYYTVKHCICNTDGCNSINGPTGTRPRIGTGTQ